MAFLQRLFGRKAEEMPVAVIPEGQRVYAIGDIHGRDDLFQELLGRIAADTAARGPAEVTLILLGDLVDRGPDSRAVVDRAIALVAEGHARAIKGNHEEALLSALDGDEKALEMLLRFGGDATFVSYGVPGIEVFGLDSGSLVMKLYQAIPREHVQFFKEMESKIAIGDYLFVHAGVRPGTPLTQQKGADLRWIRDDFLGHEGYHGAMIVHGHSITPEPEMKPNRLGIDTGAYASGVLTALGLEGEERWLIQTGQPVPSGF